MLVAFGICLKQYFDTRYLVFYNTSPPRMFLSLDFLFENIGFNTVLTDPFMSHPGGGGGGGGGTRVHHGRVGSAGLCDLKFLHPWRRLKKGVKILQWPPPPPNARKGGQYSTSVWKVCKKGGQKSTIVKKYRGQNSPSLKMGVKILHAEK